MTVDNRICCTSFRTEPVRMWVGKSLGYWLQGQEVEVTINFSNYHKSFAIEQQGKTCVIAQKMLSSLKGAENVGIYPAQGSNVP